MRKVTNGFRQVHPGNTNESLKDGVLLILSGMVLIRLDNRLHIVEAWRRIYWISSRTCASVRSVGYAVYITYILLKNFIVRAVTICAYWLWYWCPYDLCVKLFKMMPILAFMFLIVSFWFTTELYYLAKLLANIHVFKITVWINTLRSYTFYMRMERASRKWAPEVWLIRKINTWMH